MTSLLKNNTNVGSFLYVKIIHSETADKLRISQNEM